MRHRTDRHLVVLVVALSLGLTALTVWAVAQQGRALSAREWAEVRNAAHNAAAERSTRLLADLERAFTAATEARRLGGTAELDRWIDENRRWCFAAVVTAGTATVLPITPMQMPLPPADVDGPPLRYDPEFTETETREALAHFERAADNPDQLVRARAALAAADCQRRLGDERAAARLYAQAAQTLRATPGLARYAFEPEAERIACLLAAGEFQPATDLLASMLDEMAAGHPARYSPAEVRLLRRRAAPLLTDDAAAHLDTRLHELEQRALVRSAVPDLATASAARCAAGTPTDTGSELSFLRTRPDGTGGLIAPLWQDPAGDCLALAVRAGDLLAEYWAAEPDAVWQVAGGPRPGRILCELGEPFGGAVLVPSAQVQAQLASRAARRTTLVIVTAAGTAGAWAVALWMMLRAVARQRELVRLQRRFVADVSHELKTPLAMIRLLAETLQDGRVRDPERVSSYHATITREAERLSLLLDSILDFSRIESGRKHYEFGHCRLADVVRQAWTLFEPQFAAAGFERVLEIAPDLPVIQADAAAVQQVVVNLLQNAFRYGGDGRYVRLSVTRDGGLVVIAVEDHGIGMTRAQLQRLGDTFFRAEDTRVRQTRGSGLGLAIVNHIVHAHGGKVEVHSRPNKGSTFTVWFPFDPPDAPGPTR